jgi:hypothetical protein
MKLPLPQLLSRLRLVNRIGDDILRTHNALGTLEQRFDGNPDKLKTIEGLQRVQEERIEDFQYAFDHAINDWDASDLNRYWTGMS